MTIDTPQQNVLDHGYVKLIETWGSDARIVESARMSTNKGFLGWKPEVQYTCSECEYVFVDDQPVDRAIDCPSNPSHGRMTYNLVHHGDERFLKFLYENKHLSPFEQAGLTLEIQAPIFVFREWHRHRTQSYNEMSGRYTQLPDLYYMPSEARIKMSKQSSTNKQSSEAGEFTWQEMTTIQETILNQLQDARHAYEDLLKLGVAREVARVVIPVAQYSRMRASANLRNWLHFLSLRMDPAAQWEIRQFANAVAETILFNFPRTYKLFMRRPDR